MEQTFDSMKIYGVIDDSSIFFLLYDVKRLCVFFFLSNYQFGTIDCTFEFINFIMLILNYKYIQL
jgi:hypothetical protein